MAKDTETTLLAFFNEVRARKEKLKTFAEGDPRRDAVLTEYMAGKAEYNRRKDELEKLLKLHDGETSSEDPVRVAYVATTEVPTSKNATSHSDKTPPKVDSVELKNASLRPVSEEECKKSRSPKNSQVRSHPSNLENASTAKHETRIDDASFTILTLKGEMNQLALIAGNLDNSIKELKHDIQCLRDSIKELSNSFASTIRQGHDRNGTDANSTGKEAAKDLLDDLIRRGITLFETALNTPSLTPSSQFEKEGATCIRRLLWAGLTACQQLGSCSARDSLSLQGEILRSPPSDGISDLKATSDLKDGEGLPEAGKRKLESIEEEPQNDPGKDESNGESKKPESKRLRSNSKARQ